MKRLAILTAATVLAATAAAVAHTVTYESTVEIQAACEVPCEDSKRGFSAVLVGGLVDSENPKCIAGRKVQVLRVDGEDTAKVDVAKTSKNGAWAGFGDFEGAEAIGAKLTKRKLKQKGHKHTCGGATADELALP